MLKHGFYPCFTGFTRAKVPDMPDYPRINEKVKPPERRFHRRSGGETLPALPLAAGLFWDKPGLAWASPGLPGLAPASLPLWLSQYLQCW